MQAPVMGQALNVMATARQLKEYGVPEDRVERARKSSNPTRLLLALCITNGVTGVYWEFKR